jgi:uncharacterized protein
MSWNIVPLDEVVSSPWKNGGGTTRELIAWPNSDQWVWRMSVAEVKQGGPFSIFQGVQRWFAVLSGAGVTLDVSHAGQLSSHSLKRDSSPFCFDGEAAVNCELLDSVTHDFNLMLHKSQAQGRMQRVSGTHKLSLKATTEAKKMVAVYSNGQPTTLQVSQEPIVSIQILSADTLAWQYISADATIQLDSPDALLMEISHHV